MAGRGMEELELLNAESINENICAKKSALYGYDLANLQWRRVAVDANGQIVTTTEEYTVQVENDVNGNPIYRGFAVPGTPTSAAAWKIIKITYDASENPTAIQYADGNPKFDNIYDNRAGYSYS